MIKINQLFNKVTIVINEEPPLVFEKKDLMLTSLFEVGFQYNQKSSLFLLKKFKSVSISFSFGNNFFIN